MSQDNLIWKASPSLLMIIPQVFRLIFAITALGVLYTVVKTSYFDEAMTSHFFLDFVLSILKGYGQYLLYAGCIFVIFLKLNIIWRVIAISLEVYSLDNQRFYFDTGVFNRFNDETELFRVLDYEVEKPFFLRIFGYGNLNLYSNDPSTESGVYGQTFVTIDGTKGMRITAIKDPDSLKKMIREKVEAARAARKVNPAELI